MGRGRAKAKQAKVARQLKYNSGGTDLERLRAELGVEELVDSGRSDEPDLMTTSWPSGTPTTPTSMTRTMRTTPHLGAVVERHLESSVDDARRGSPRRAFSARPREGLALRVTGRYSHSLYEPESAAGGTTPGGLS